MITHAAAQGRVSVADRRWLGVGRCSPQLDQSESGFQDRDPGCHDNVLVVAAGHGGVLLKCVQLCADTWCRQGPPARLCPFRAAPMMTPFRRRRLTLSPSRCVASYRVGRWWRVREHRILRLLFLRGAGLRLRSLPAPSHLYGLLPQSPSTRTVHAALRLLKKP
jgi:hypothetical protein